MKSLGAVFLLLIVSALVHAQVDTRRLHSHPTPPDEIILERLHMKQAWKAYVPMDSKRDGLFSVQIAPYYLDKKLGMHLIVQNRSGLVVCLDAETGKQLWRTLVGRPYAVTQMVGFNRNAVAVLRGTEIYGIDRFTGQTRWRLLLNSTVESAPVIDYEHLFVSQSSNNSVVAYTLPRLDEKSPHKDWDYTPFLPLDLQPVMTKNFLVLPSSKGEVQVMFKEVPRPYLRYKTDGKLRARPGIHEKDGFIYIGSEDANLYAERVEDVTTLRPWRFTAGESIIRTPFVNDDDVFPIAEKSGLFRLYRRGLTGAQLGQMLIKRGYLTANQLQAVTMELGPRAADANEVLQAAQKKNYLTENQRLALVWRAGASVWQNRDADRVLSVNPKFVYAFDRSGRLMIISRTSGKELSRYTDAREFPHPIINELTDRLYLGAHDGLIICLHDRDYVEPVLMKSIPESLTPVPKKGNKNPMAK